MSLIDALIREVEGDIEEEEDEISAPRLKQIKRFASNMRVGLFYDSGYVEVMYSYETPVAMKKLDFDGIVTGRFKTDVKWSSTTTRHISKWGCLGAPEISQDELNRFNPWEYMKN